MAERYRRTMSGSEALARARRAASAPLTSAVRGTTAKQLLALRWFRESERLPVQDYQAEAEERAARRAIAFLDHDRFTRTDWDRLSAAHEQVRNARLALHRGNGTAGALAAAWRLVAAIARTLPKV